MKKCSAAIVLVVLIALVIVAFAPFLLSHFIIPMEVNVFAFEQRWFIGLTLFLPAVVLGGIIAIMWNEIVKPVVADFILWMLRRRDRIWKKR